LIEQTYRDEVETDDHETGCDPGSRLEIAQNGDER
jgi:hypothetical protein